MSAIGWRPRALGWFTQQLAPDATGVIAASTASKHANKGEVFATLHVGLRLERVETIVRAICQLPVEAGGYRNRTASTSIGYLMPSNGWHEWRVDHMTAAEVALEMARAVEAYASPYLQALLCTEGSLLDAIRMSPRASQASGLCAEVVFLVEHGCPDEARLVLRRRLEVSQGRSDPAAETERCVAQRLSDWITAEEHHL